MRKLNQFSIYGMVLKCTFRRCVDERLMNLWLEVVQLASAISFSDEEDSLIWLALMVFILLNPYIELLILEELCQCMYLLFGG